MKNNYYLLALLSLFSIASQAQSPTTIALEQNQPAQTTTSLLGQWHQVHYQELVVRDGEQHPHEQSYKKGDHSFIFQKSNKGIEKYKNTETGQIEESAFTWTFKKQKLTITSIVDAGVQDALPEVYTVTTTTQGLVLESMEKDDAQNYIYNKITLSK